MYVLLLIFFALPGFCKELTLNNFSACYLNNGALKCWGSNENGIIPEVYPEDVSKPLLMGVFSQVVSADMTDDYGCAISKEGEVKCWGKVLGGERIGFTTFKTTSSAKSISVGSDFACAVLHSGEVECMNKGSQSFKKVEGLPEIQQVATGTRGVCALTTTGTSYCWGVLSGGAHGDDLTPVPSKAMVPDTLTALAKYEEQWGLTDSGKVVYWIGVKHPSRSLQIKEKVRHFEADTTSGCAATVEGYVYCWGSNQGGVVPQEKSDWLSLPVKVEGISGAKKIFYGPRIACAQLEDESIKCWGTGFRFLGNNEGDHLRPYDFKID